MKLESSFASFVNTGLPFEIGAQLRTRPAIAKPSGLPVGLTARVLAELARRLGGRTLGLFTSLRRMHQVAEQLSEDLRGQGLDLLARKKDFGRRLAEAVRARPEEILVTDVWSLPQTLASEFQRRKIFLVQSPEQGRRLLARLRERGETRFFFVTGSLERRVELGAIVVDDGGLGFFSQQLVPRELPRGGPPQSM